MTELHPALEEQLRERGFFVTASGQEAAVALRLAVKTSWDSRPGSQSYVPPTGPPGSGSSGSGMVSSPGFTGWKHTASVALINSPDEATEPVLLIDWVYALPGFELLPSRSYRTVAAKKLAKTLARNLDKSCREFQEAK